MITKRYNMLILFKHHLLLHSFTRSNLIIYIYAEGIHNGAKENPYDNPRSLIGLKHN